MPEDNEAYRALELADEALGGVIPLRVLVESTGGESMTSDASLAALGDVDAMLGAVSGVSGTLSILDVVRSLPGDGIEWLPLVSASARARLVGMEGKAAIVSAKVRDDGAAALEPIFLRIGEKLAGIEARHPGVTMRLTGVTYVSASISLSMISELAWSLFAAASIILLIIILALRSPVLGLFSVLPNVFPLAATGAMLVLVGMPIQYTSVMSFTICLGIAVDDTIHLLMRYRKLQRSGVAADAAVRQTLREVGAVLVTTTLIMVGSFLVLQVSELPMIRLFGLMCALALAWAVIGDLIFLPAILAWWERRRSKV
ncbi:MAG: putative RND superfamily exporter protein [Pseudoalteromonas tetraodonis]